ncbi:MAG: hypothetical protein A2026_16110 [Deltaproteobacteria bacterium RBG_19FT_COMBO_46_12]|nr:MAG: hypothetical protein A2026_16110 [Deltaproteobacteria bacterium RBG_19FT_COMBO_46_12]
MNINSLGITRRKLLKMAAAGTALTLAGRPSFSFGKEEYDLAVISGEPAAATKKVLETLGGISRFVKKGQRVILKPNMSFSRTPDFSATTHPAVVATVAQACVEAGASQVLVLDHTLQRAELCLERTGIREACKNIAGVHVLAIQERKFFREVKIPQGIVLERVEVMKEILDSQVLINLPVAKSHSATGVSMGMKGLMGVIWDRESFHSKYNINQAIADLGTVVKPQLTILDATRALASGGPGGPGTVMKPNLVIAGVDPVAVDSYGVSIVPWYGQNFKGRQVEHLLMAHQRGLGKIDIDQLKIFKEKV